MDPVTYRSRCLNPCDYFFWKKRGYKCRPDNWEEILEMEGYWDRDDYEYDDSNEEEEYVEAEEYGEEEECEEEEEWEEEEECEEEEESDEDDYDDNDEYTENDMKSRQNNPCDILYWQARGYSERPANWKHLAHQFSLQASSGHSLNYKTSTGGATAVAVVPKFNANGVGVNSHASGRTTMIQAPQNVVAQIAAQISDPPAVIGRVFINYHGAGVAPKTSGTFTTINVPKIPENSVANHTTASVSAINATNSDIGGAATATTPNNYREGAAAALTPQTTAIGAATGAIKRTNTSNGVGGTAAAPVSLEGANSTCKKQEKTGKESPSDSELEDLCKVCWEKPLNCVLLNCNHLCCCTHCAAKLKSCPICRKKIDRTLRIFKS